jgi:hypothetical protein
MYRLEVCFDLPPKLPRLGMADVPFAARLGDGLPEQIDPATRTEEVRHGFDIAKTDPAENAECGKRLGMFVRASLAVRSGSKPNP